MLRSTGFFRGIDCPFYTESYNGKIVKNGCNRPYCHFRHSNQRRTSIGAFEVRKTKELSSSTNEECYDPFSPEVVRPEDHRNEEPETKLRPGSPMDVGAIELELVNRAIEAVQCEVERERKKLSHIGDQEYEPTSSASTVGPKRKKPVPVASHQGYDPGSYQMTQGTDYSPTPRSNKYVLDSESEENHGSSMEYVPTTVSKTSAKKSLLFSPTSRTSKLPSSPQSSSSVKCKYTLDASKSPLDSESEDNHSSSLEYVPTAVSKMSKKKSLLFSTTSRTSNLPSSPQRSTSVKNKYTLDKSKPLTDMEYDPLSNFSAKLASKNKAQRALTTDAETKKVSPPTSKRKQSIDEEYVPTVKKPRPQQQPVVDSQKYSAYFAESDEESSGTEYRPMLLSHLQRRKNASASAEDSTRRSSEEKGDVAPSSRVLKQQRSQNSKPEEASSQGDSEDPEEILDRERPREKVPEKKAKDSRDSQKKSSKNGDAKREEKRPSGKSSGEKVRTESSSSDKKKKPSSESVKKTERTDDKNRLKDKVAHKSRKEEKSTDGKSKRPEKVKGELSHKEKERSNEVKKHKTDKTHERDSSSKYKDQKNGKLHSAGKDKDKSKSSQGSGSVSKDKSRKSSSSSGGKVAKVGRQKQRSLSHVDLFGDESGEEARQEEDDDDDDDDDEEEEEEIIVRKSASAHRRTGLLSNKKDSVDRRSFSEEEIGQEDDRSDVDVDDGGVDYSSLQDVDYDSDPDPLEECLRIFNESKDVKAEDKGRQAKQPTKESADHDVSDSTLSKVIPGQKKRVSHFAAKGSESSRASVVRPYRRPTAQEMCYQRMQMAQQQAEQLAVVVKAAAAASSSYSLSSSSTAFSAEKKRVAHRPNPSALSLKASSEAKTSGSRVLSPTRATPELSSVKAHTSAGILSKTMSTSMQKRVAHTPTMKSSSMKRPVIPIEFGAKVPTGVRQRYLNLFIDECLKVCPAEPTAFQMALDEEQVVYDRSSSKNIYLNVAVNTLKKLRSKSTLPASNPPKYQAAGASQKIQSHEKMLGGRMAAKTSFTINRKGKQQEMELRGACLYTKLKEYLMTEEQLQEHGYPRPNPDRSGHVIIHNAPEKKNLDPFSKVCCRCGAEYKINVNGSCVRKEECCHHWGRLRRHRVSGGWETHYNCCSGAVGSLGCQVSKQHVQDGRKEAVEGYVKTFDKSLPADGDAGVFALDCEMSYTKQGLELTRVTVINSELKVIYDTFVKPDSKVVDYNTRFSGVTEEDLESCSITMRDVQAVLLSMFSSESILIGHSLESDLTALKLVHSTVVDTAIVFPHRLGLPYKRALRNLMADHLKRIIQDNVEGHDSSEDACACMELMMWKIKEDAKVKR
ncbi:RNA exonuclease 1 homolog isoform X2 [Sardina pilchardus]|uniref:RNA exonuclease 1 homolog isoform X2 n=1 Tax=Sardina pilchardus TaxID=27697 RepID=UPI002E0DB8FC